MEFQNRQAIYIQIGDFILENILTKKWLPGNRIPSVREMAVNVEVNPNTVMRTYSYLQDKGIIQNQRGIGYFVDESSYDNALKEKKEEFLREELPKLIKMMEILRMTFDDLKKYLEEAKNKLMEQKESKI